MLAISLAIACLRYVHYGVILHAHPIRGESHNQRNTTAEVATTSPPFYNEPHRSHVVCVKAWIRHDPHILVTAPFCCDRKSRAVCAQSFAPWQQATMRSCLQSLLLLLARAMYIIKVLFFMHIPFVVNHTINTTPPERLQQYFGWPTGVSGSKVMIWSNKNIWLISWLDN